MELYVIAHRTHKAYLAIRGYNDTHKSQWTTDLSFAVFGSDKSVLDTFLGVEQMGEADIILAFRTREVTDEEYHRLIELQLWHKGLKFTPTNS